MRRRDARGGPRPGAVFFRQPTADFPILAVSASSRPFLTRGVFHQSRRFEGASVPFFQALKPQFSRSGAFDQSTTQEK